MPKDHEVELTTSPPRRRSDYQVMQTNLLFLIATNKKEIKEGERAINSFAGRELNAAEQRELSIYPESVTLLQQNVAELQAAFERLEARFVNHHGPTLTRSSIN